MHIMLEAMPVEPGRRRWYSTHKEDRKQISFSSNCWHCFSLVSLYISISVSNIWTTAREIGWALLNWRTKPERDRERQRTLSHNHNYNSPQIFALILASLSCRLKLPRSLAFICGGGNQLYILGLAFAWELGAATRHAYLIFANTVLAIVFSSYSKFLRMRQSSNR